jgi:hypothetical protein
MLLRSGNGTLKGSVVGHIAVDQVDNIPPLEDEGDEDAAKEGETDDVRELNRDHWNAAECLKGWLETDAEEGQIGRKCCHLCAERQFGGASGSDGS